MVVVGKLLLNLVYALNFHWTQLTKAEMSLRLFSLFSFVDWQTLFVFDSRLQPPDP